MVGQYFGFEWRWLEPDCGASWYISFRYDGGKGKYMPAYFGLDGQTMELGSETIGHFLTMVVNFNKYITINKAIRE